MCPKVALFLQVAQQRSHEDPPSTPLARVMTPERSWENITPTMILKTPKNAVGLCGPNLVFKVKGVSSRSLCAAVDMDLLFSGVDIGIIKIIDHWHINEMLSSLHVQADPPIRNFLRLMLTHGTYYFMPHKEEVTCF